MNVWRGRIPGPTPAQQAHDRFAYVGIQVHRIDELSVWKAPRQLSNRSADVLESVAEVFSAVTGNKDQTRCSRYGRPRFEARSAVRDGRTKPVRLLRGGGISNSDGGAPLRNATYGKYFPSQTY